MSPAAPSATALKLVHMANQISRFFVSQPREDAVAGVADHIAKFWDPRMRRQAFAYIEAGGEGFEPTALAALKRLAEAQVKAG